MKYFLSLTIMLYLTMIANAAVDNCQKDCTIVASDKREACLIELAECTDQILLNKVIFFEKNGIKKDLKFLLIKELSSQIENFNKQIAQLQLRRAMYNKLTERAKQVVIVQE